MVWNSIKKAHGVKKIRKLLGEYYEGEVLEKLVSELYPLLDRVGYEGLERVVSLCTQLDRYSGRTAVTLLEESQELIDRLLTYGDKDLVMNVYGLCSQLARYSEGTAIRLLGQSPELIDRVGYAGFEKIAGLSSQVAREDSFVAAKLLGISPGLIDRVGYEGLEKVACLCSRIAKDRRFIAALLEMTPRLIDRVGYDVFEKVACLCSQAAGYSGRTAVRLLELGPELIERVGYDALEKVVTLCSQIAREDSFVAARLLELSPELIERVSYECLWRMAKLCCQVNKDDSFIAARLLDGSPEFIERLLEFGDDELVTDVYGLCSQVAQTYNWRTAVRLQGMSPELIERLLRYGDKELVKAVYELCSQVAKYSGRTAVSLLEASPDLIAKADYEGLVKVAYKASEIAKVEGEEKATSFVRGESSEYADFFEAVTKGLELKKIKPVLLHYLNALLGYGIEIVEVEGEGVRATTDGERIFLPERIKEFEEEDRNFVMFKVLATHEEAHLEYGSFDFELTNVQDVVGRIKARYSGREMNGISDTEKFYTLFPEPALAKDLITILEDYRINSRLQAEYPVLGEQISEMNVHMVSKRVSLDELANDKQRAVEIIAQRLIAGTTKEQIEQVPVKILQTCEQALSISQTLSSPHADVHETARVAAELYFLIDDNFQGLYQPINPFSSPLDQSQVNQNIGNFGRTARKINEKLSSEPTNTNDNKDVRELLRALFKKKGIKPKDVESRIDTLEPKMVKDYLCDLETLITDEKELRREQDTFLYPEWGSDIEDYRLNWSRVRERILDGGSDEFYLETIQKYAGQIKIIRREFQMLRPEGSIKLRAQFEGDDVDLDSAVQYFIDKRLKLSPSERNYVRTEKRTRDIVVAFLLDMSGSTAGATILCEKEALILMSEALKELGDAFAIYGFSGYGRDNVAFYIIKDFEEPYDQRVQCKISTITNKQSTRIAPAIRHTTTKLRRREEKTKVLILLSDGKPLDRDYFGNYAIEDTRMALREAQRYGIKSFCITVDREAAEYLPRMYGNSRWVVIDDVVKLPEKITRIYKRFTT